MLSVNTGMAAGLAMGLSGEADGKTLQASSMLSGRLTQHRMTTARLSVPNTLGDRATVALSAKMAHLSVAAAKTN